MTDQRGMPFAAGHQAMVADKGLCDRPMRLDAPTPARHIEGKFPRGGGMPLSTASIPAVERSTRS